MDISEKQTKLDFKQMNQRVDLENKLLFDLTNSKDLVYTLLNPRTGKELYGSGYSKFSLTPSYLPKIAYLDSKSNLSKDEYLDTQLYFNTSVSADIKDKNVSHPFHEIKSREEHLFLRRI